MWISSLIILEKSLLWWISISSAIRYYISVFDFEEPYINSDGKTITKMSIWIFHSFYSTELQNVFVDFCHYPAGIHLLKVNRRNTRPRCETCSKSTIKTPDWRQWRRSGAFIVNFEYILQHVVLVLLLLHLNI